MVPERSSAAVDDKFRHRSPDDLFHDLWTCLADHRAILAKINRRKGHSGPSIADCQTIARRQIEMLKHHGIVTVVRQVSAKAGDNAD
jgi:hypothetical protein